MNSTNVIDLRSAFEHRHCTPGSMASHVQYGLVAVINARGMQREIQYAFERTNVRGRSGFALSDTLEIGTTWVHVSELELRLPTADLHPAQSQLRHGSVQRICWAPRPPE